MRVILVAAAIFVLSTPVLATTFAPVDKICPVGGEKFSSLEMMSTTTWGQLPDGMPLGVGPNPAPLPQCPGNGLVIYKEFDEASIPKLSAFVMSDAYQAQRADSTPRYLAYLTATELGDEESRPWLLLGATWEAKNGHMDALATRYMNELVKLVELKPLEPTKLESIAIKARAANTLRELGRFEAAESLRASIKIADDAGGNEPDSKDNREGWAYYISSLAAPIARGDSSRDPIDMIGNRLAAERCFSAERKVVVGDPPSRRLNEFEAPFCQRAEIQRELTTIRKWRAQSTE